MYLTLPDLSQSLCSAWSELQILLVFAAFTHTGGGFEVLILAFYLPQVLPAWPSCAGCASEGTWAGRASAQSPSCTCLSHWRTSSCIDRSDCLRLGKKEEQMLVYFKFIISKKKKSKASFATKLWLQCDSENWKHLFTGSEWYHGCSSLTIYCHMDSHQPEKL